MALEPKRTHTQGATEGSENDTNALVALLCQHVPDLTLLRYLSPRDLAQLAQTCQRLRVVIADHYFWAHLSPIRITEYFKAEALKAQKRMKSLTQPITERDTLSLSIPGGLFRSRSIVPLLFQSVQSTVIIQWLCLYGRLDMIRILLAFARKTNESTRAFYMHGNVAAACRSGNVLLVEYLYTQASKAETHAFRTSSAMSAACISGNLLMVKYLYEEARVSHKEVRSANIVLCAACKNGHAAIVAYLLEVVQLPVDDAILGYEPPIDLACGAGNIDVVRYLFETAGLTAHDIRGTRANPLGAAVCDERLNVVQYLCDHAGFGIQDILYAKSTLNYSMSCPLSVACMSTRADIARFFLARITTADDIALLLEIGVLETACRHGNLDIVRDICDILRLDVRHDRRHIYLAFRAACMSGHVNVVRYIRDHHNLPYDAVREHNGEALWLAAGSGRLEVVQYICEEIGVPPGDICGVAHRNLTAAIDIGAIDVAQYLVRHGQLTRDEMREVCVSTLQTIMKMGRATVLQFLFDYLHLSTAMLVERRDLVIAVKFNQPAIIQCFLRNAGVLDDQTRSHCRTLVVLACAHRHSKIVECLFGEGGLAVSDINADTYHIRDAAIASGDPDIVGFLHKLVTGG
jgi:ankyrin repeat protein